MTPTDGIFLVFNGTTLVPESGATARTSIGLGTAHTPQFTGIELGHATDTTLTRASAGRIAIEGVNVVTESSTDTLANKTLTSPTVNGVTNGTGLAAGTYTPTSSALSNMDSVVGAGSYIRVGNQVQVGIRVTANATAAGAASFELTIPVASNFGALADAKGGAWTATSGEHGIVSASAANDTVIINYTAVNTGAVVMTINFIYTVI